MKKTILLTLMILLSIVTIAKAQEKFENKTLALLENIAMNSEQKNIIEFLKKADYEKVSESDKEDEKSYYFVGPNSEMMQIAYTKSKKMMHVAMIIASDFPILIDMQTNLSRHTFKNRDYELFHWGKSSYPYQFLTRKDDSGNANVFLLTKHSKNYQD